MSWHRTGKHNATPSDLRWMKQVNFLLQKNISNAQFSIVELASNMRIGERQFRRRLKKITGYSPIQYFQIIRLKYAHLILEEGRYETVSQVSYAVGFDTPYYFTQLYQKYFGKRPAEYFF